MEINKVTKDISVSRQISLKDISKIKEIGFKSSVTAADEKNRHNKKTKHPVSDDIIFSDY